MSELEQCKERLKRAEEISAKYEDRFFSSLYGQEHLSSEVARQKEALQIIATWAACDISSPDSREKAMRDIQEKAMEGLHKDD